MHVLWKTSLTIFRKNILQKRKENLIIKEQEKKSENEKREIRDEIQEIDNEI